MGSVSEGITSITLLSLMKPETTETTTNLSRSSRKALIFSESARDKHAWATFFCQFLVGIYSDFNTVACIFFTPRFSTLFVRTCIFLCHGFRLDSIGHQAAMWPTPAHLRHITWCRHSAFLWEVRKQRPHAISLGDWGRVNPNSFKESWSRTDGIPIGFMMVFVLVFFWSPEENELIACRYDIFWRLLLLLYSASSSGYLSNLPPPDLHLQRHSRGCRANLSPSFYLFIYFINKFD